jgi:histidine ammonia-lyase
MRCSPQVHGAARDTLAHAEVVASRELDSAVDNPVVTLDGRVESNGNFHGAPVGYALDFLGHRGRRRGGHGRTAHGPVPRRQPQPRAARRSSAGDPGVDSGLMIAQYTQAAIVSDLKRLANPCVRRHDPVQRDAGGPRLDGLVRLPASCAGRSTG